MFLLNLVCQLTKSPEKVLTPNNSLAVYLLYFTRMSVPPLHVFDKLTSKYQVFFASAFQVQWGPTWGPKK